MNKLIVNCETGETTTVELGETEVAKYTELWKKKAELKAQALAPTPDMERVKRRAEVDPDFAALARATGVLKK